MTASVCPCDGYRSMWAVRIPSRAEVLICCPFCCPCEATLKVLAHTESWGKS